MGLVLSTQGTWRMPHIEWHFDKGTGVPYYCEVLGARVAEVEVDGRTGDTRVLHICAAHDGGRVIFPQGALGQMYGGIAQGLGYGLFEEMNFHQGYPQSLNFDGYLIPTALDIPPVEGTFIEMPFAEGPYGAKNMAEPLMIAAAPAVGNAIFQATGRRVRSTPLTMERVLLGHALAPGGAVQQCRTVLGVPAQPGG